MQAVLSVENMRASDRSYMAEAGLSEVALVAKVADAIASYEKWEGKIAIVCGRGNNGADGLALASVLKHAGGDVTVYYIEGERSEACAYYWAHLPASVARIEVREGSRLEGYDVVFDCIFGTGFQGKPRGAAADAIGAVNQSGARVVSVDINSGLSADSGMAETCVKSQLTLAIGGIKAGHLLNMARDQYAVLDNLDVGIRPIEKPYYLLERRDARGFIPARKHFSNKGDYGYVALIGGSAAYSGAIRLAAMAAAAMRAGAGVVKVATAKSLCPLLVPQVLESTLYPLAETDGHVAFDEKQVEMLVARVKTVAFGMGVGASGDSKGMLAYLLAHYAGRLIVDADGLSMLAELSDGEIAARRCELVLTPHLKEFARLTGKSIEEICRNTIPYAKAYARKTGAVLVLKGPTTVVTDGNEVVLVDAGSPGMATAGSGDVLSGILAATTAYVEDMLSAVCLGVYINGKAGEKAAEKMGEVSMVASDTVAQVAAVVKDLCRR